MVVHLLGYAGLATFIWAWMKVLDYGWYQARRLYWNTKGNDPDEW